MEKAVALYIHIPFCKSKCLYCDFPSYCGMEDHMIDYCKALSKEINSIKSDVEISSIFIGGGTPTYLSLDGWEIIKQSIDKLNKNKDIEFTVEGNPGTFERSKLQLLKRLGVNRLSMGLQALQNELLKKLGRIHTKEDFFNSFNMAREEGFQNINVDLMFSLPGQSLMEWEETLREIIALKPEHISSYGLILEEGTPFKEMYEEHKLSFEEEDTEIAMYDLALKLLKENGYKHYEISNFSKYGKECKHNLVYWSMEDYIGCGSSSHSYVNGKRYSNECDIKKYIAKMEKGNSAVIEEYLNSLEDNIEEFVFMGLRKIQGIDIGIFKKRYGLDIFEVYGEIINKHIKSELLTFENEKIRLTQLGISLSNIVMSDFILDKV